MKIFLKYFFLKSCHRLSLAFCLLACFLPLLAQANAGSGVHLEDPEVNPRDLVSLQRGAQLFVNNCLSCHSAKYVRYERVAEDLQIPKDIMQEQLLFTAEKLGDPMKVAMTQTSAKKWFGASPPDLSLETRLRGNDWVYSYLTGFYKDPTRPWGVNNRVFPDVGMPHVLESLQASLGEEAFHQAMRDLTNFMAYMADPVKVKRERIGFFVLLFLAFLMIPVYFLNREYWKDIR